MKNHIIFIIITCLVRVYSYAQEDASYWKYIEIPPTPQVWQFATYGSKEQNLYTGTVSASIPIYTYKDPDFEIPISLDYSSNGYRPNQQAGATGLGWTLKAGGYITRRIIGLRDDFNLPGSCKGFYIFHKLGGQRQIAPDVFNTQKPVEGHLSEYLSFDGYQIYLRAITDRNNPFYRPHTWTESTPDEFTFNFLDHAGQFMMEGGDSIFVYNTLRPRGEYKVDLSELIQSNDFILSQNNSCISITTGDGYIYRFRRLDDQGAYDTWEPEWDRTYRSFDVPYLYWPLSEIIAPNGRIVQFIYSDRLEYNDNFRWFTEYYDTYLNLYEGGLPICYFTREHVRQLTEIKIDSLSIKFGYTPRTPEIHKYEGNRIPPAILSAPDKLSLITVYDTSNNRVIRSCSLDYAYAPVGNPVLFLKQVDISGVGVYNLNYYNTNLEFPAQGTVHVDHWGYYNKKRNQDPIIYWTNMLSSNYNKNYIYPEVTVNDLNQETVISDCKAPNHTSAMMGMLQKITYPTGGYTYYYYEPHSYKAKVTKDLTHNNKSYLMHLVDTETAGGVRIYQIKDHTTTKDFIAKTYFYQKEAGRENSGILLHSPRYKHDGNSTTLVYQCNTLKYPRDRYHIGYSEVKESFMEITPDTKKTCGYNIYSFSNYEDHPDTDYNSNFVAFRFPDQENPESEASRNLQSEFNSKYIERGKLNKLKKYDDFGKLRLTIENIYQEHPIDYYITTFKATRMHFYASSEKVKDTDIQKKVITEYKDNGSVVTTKEYTYNDLGQIIKETTSRNFANIKTHIKTYPYDLANKSDIANKMLAANITNPILSESIYNQTRLVDSKRYTYDIFSGLNKRGLILLSKIEDVKNGTNNLPIYKTIATFNYNNYGRISQIQDANKNLTCLLWGYNNLYPVAIGKNQFIQTVYDAIGTTHVGQMTTDVRDKILRISRSEFTIYEYIPYVGISAITNPRGETIRYNYNKNAQLSEIFSPTSEILMEYQYSNE